MKFLKKIEDLINKRKFIKHNQKVFEIIKSNSNDNGKILVEFNNFISNHIGFSYLVNALQKKYKYLKSREIGEYAYHIVKFNILNYYKFINQKNVLIENINIKKIIKKINSFNNNWIEKYFEIKKIKENKKLNFPIWVEDWCLEFINKFNNFIKEEYNKNINSTAELDRLFQSLKIINSRLWTIEDDKRKCEKEKDFGKNFIKLSRDVHILNDDRAKIKLEINTLTGSKIKEIKEYFNY